MEDLEQLLEFLGRMRSVFVVKHLKMMIAWRSKTLKQNFCDCWSSLLESINDKNIRLLNIGRFMNLGCVGWPQSRSRSHAAPGVGEWSWAGAGVSARSGVNPSLSVGSKWNVEWGVSGGGHWRSPIVVSGCWPASLLSPGQWWRQNSSIQDLGRLRVWNPVKIGSHRLLNQSEISNILY